jgi:hypothetical protein
VSEPTIRAPAERADAEPGTPPGRSREHRLVLAATLVGVLGIAVLGLVLTPDARGVGTHEQLGLPPCLTMELWNVPCPGCGVTTSLALASSGRFGASLANQPFGFALWLAGVLFIAWCWVQHARGRDLGVSLRSWRAARWFAAAGAVAVAAWIYKIALVQAG